MHMMSVSSRRGGADNYTHAEHHRTMPQLMLSLSEHFGHLGLQCEFGAVRPLLAYFDFSLDFCKISFRNECSVSNVEWIPFIATAHPVKTFNFSN
jgi:hypothetical protein